ncbi:type 1 fimbrial protein [Serratia fonticola]|uniref:fimbrial protein n=1 Tax=Serratia fonticola TaxID=47917 RepID=UPI001AE71E9C|nr:type 1 fimbrial protein [Serratia fonticola]MBP1038856.1 type 1 fimbrial protein [Serratia fonticola]
MRKSIFTLAPVVAALLAGSGVAQAASNAQMTITANVEAATCDVTVSNPSLDLGNHAKSAFTDVAKPLASSVRTFTVGLSNCETPLTAGDKASLIVTGDHLGGNPNIFNSSGTNTGIMLSQTATPTNYITNGQKLAVATAGASPTAGDFNTKILSLQAGLASTSLTPDIGMVRAPILFSFAYN